MFNNENIESDPELADYNGDSFFSFYRSIDIGHIEDDKEIIALSIENKIVPYTVRYSLIKGTKRGVISDKENNQYYFMYNNKGKFKLVKADDPDKIKEADRLLKSCTFGVDMIKAKDEEDKDNDKEKAVATPSTGHLPVPEEQNVVAQNRILTEEHPGAEGASTPDTNAAKWHPDVVRSAKKAQAIETLNNLSKSLSSNYIMNRTPTKKEQEFMVEVLGRTPEEASSGRSGLSPTQKVAFQQWVGKSLDSKLSKLKKWSK